MKWADSHTPTGYPVFVIWKTVEKDGQQTRKGPVVVDIRPLNRETEPDVYPIPLQEEILAMVAGKPFVSVCDAISFFHQWIVFPPHRTRLAVVSHQGQEVFNVAVMGFRNAAAYMQRIMDFYLRKY